MNGSVARLVGLPPGISIQQHPSRWSSKRGGRAPTANPSTCAATIITIVWHARKRREAWWCIRKHAPSPECTRHVGAHARRWSTKILQREKNRGPNKDKDKDQSSENTQNVSELCEFYNIALFSSSRQHKGLSTNPLRRRSFDGGKNKKKIKQPTTHHCSLDVDHGTGGGGDVRKQPPPNGGEDR